MGVYSLTKSSIRDWVKYPNMMAGSVELSSDYLIAETLIASNTASVTFDVSTLAAQGFKHLQLRTVSRNTNGATNSDLYLRMNGDTGSSYVWHLLGGTGTGTEAAYGAAGTFLRIGGTAGDLNTANVFGCSVVDILDAFSSSKNKTTRSLAGIAGSFNRIVMWSGLWLSTAPVTSLTVTYDAGYYMMPGTRLSLYASKG